MRKNSNPASPVAGRREMKGQVCLNRGTGQAVSSTSRANPISRAVRSCILLPRDRVSVDACPEGVSSSLVPPGFLTLAGGSLWEEPAAARRFSRFIAAPKAMLLRGVLARRVVRVMRQSPGAVTQRRDSIEIGARS